MPATMTRHPLTSVRLYRAEGRRSDTGTVLIESTSNTDIALSSHVVIYRMGLGSLKQLPPGDNHFIITAYRQADETPPFHAEKMLISTHESIWSVLNHVLCRMSESAPAKGFGYDKTDMVYRWGASPSNAEEMTYKERIDLQKDVYQNAARELFRTMMFFTGRSNGRHNQQDADMIRREYGGNLREFAEKSSPLTI